MTSRLYPKVLYPEEASPADAVAALKDLVAALTARLAAVEALLKRPPERVVVEFPEKAVALNVAAPKTTAPAPCKPLEAVINFDRDAEGRIISARVVEEA